MYTYFILSVPRTLFFISDRYMGGCTLHIIHDPLYIPLQMYTTKIYPRLYKRGFCGLGLTIKFTQSDTLYTSHLTSGGWREMLLRNIFFDI